MENILGTNLDRIVILVYFAVVMGFGAYFGKYSSLKSVVMANENEKIKLKLRFFQ